MKAVLGYILTISIVLMYTLFMDVKSGFVFLSVLVIAPVISILMTLSVKKKISFNIESQSSVLNKRDKVSIITTFRKRGLIPTPFIEVKLYSTGNFDSEQSDVFKISVSCSKDEEIIHQYVAKIWGVAYIGIDYITITDYLGLIHFKIYEERGSKTYSKKFEIMPDMPQTSPDNELLRIMCDAVAYDDNEETKDNCFSLIGLPGYEHKKYSPGDQIKKINWKLSAKRDELLVRLDEAIASSKQNIVLDYSKNKYVNNDLLIQLTEERIIESVLAMLILIVNLNLECNLYYYNNNSWQHSLIKNMSDIHTIQYTLSKYSFIRTYTSDDRIPIDIMKEHGQLSTMMVFTSNFDNQLIDNINSCVTDNTNYQVVVSQLPNIPYNNAWLVDKNFVFKKI